MKFTINNKNYEVSNISNWYKGMSIISKGKNRVYGLKFKVTNTNSQCSWLCEQQLTKSIIKELNLTKEQLNYKTLSRLIQEGVFNKIIENFMNTEFATE